MKSRFTSFLMLLIITSVCLTELACKKKKKDEVTPEDIVTGINLILDAPKGKQDVIVYYNEPTGVNGKTSPNTITLDANTLYAGTITLEDESVTPQADVTNDYTINYRAVGTTLTINPNNKNPQVQTTGATTDNATFEITLTKNGKNYTTKFPLVVRP